MFSGLSTADMVAFTGRSLIAMYPKLTVQRLALPTLTTVTASEEEFSNVHEELDLIRVKLLHSNEDWARPCGSECPSLVRSISEQVGIFHLSDHPFDRVINQWQLSEGQWSLGWNCRNATCIEGYD